MSRRCSSLVLLSFLLALVAGHVAAQSSQSDRNDNPYPGLGNYNSSMVIVIIVLVSCFFFLIFFTIYVRRCSWNGDGTVAPGFAAPAFGAGNARSRRQRGVEPAVLDTLPTMVYSEVKELKIATAGAALECAVCICEFDDDETLRLLPKCSHVFHKDCIDLWFASHITCPVCRAVVDGDAKPAEATAPESTPSSLPEDAVVVDVDSEEEAVELERIGSVRRALRSKSTRPAAAAATKYPRSHSTGHSLSSPTAVGNKNHEKYTLRLPEEVLRGIVAAGKMKAVPAGEGSSRRGYRGRSLRLQLSKSDRWPSFLLRAMPANVFAGGKKGGDGGSPSVRRGEGEITPRSVKFATDSFSGAGSSSAGVEAASGDDTAGGSRQV